MPISKKEAAWLFVRTPEVTEILDHWAQRRLDVCNVRAVNEELIERLDYLLAEYRGPSYPTALAREEEHA